MERESRKSLSKDSLSQMQRFDAKRPSHVVNESRHVMSCDLCVRAPADSPWRRPAHFSLCLGACRSLCPAARRLHVLVPICLH